jgi:hypothetical protein
VLALSSFLAEEETTLEQEAERIYSEPKEINTPVIMVASDMESPFYVFLELKLVSEALTIGVTQLNYLNDMKKLIKYIPLIIFSIIAICILYSRNQPSCPTYETAYKIEFKGIVQDTYIATNNHGYKMIRFVDGRDMYFPSTLEFTGFYEMLKTGMYIEKPSKTFEVLIVTLNGDTITHILKYNCKEFPEL